MHLTASCKQKKQDERAASTRWTLAAGHAGTAGTANYKHDIQDVGASKI